MKIELPEDLKQKYDKIKAHFDSIKDDWKKYNDGIIPEDKEFAKEIINFIIDLIDYMEMNYDKLDMKKWGEFLKSYEYEFYYGIQDDDKNYLAFDEYNLCDIFMVDMNWSSDTIPSKEGLTFAKKKFIEIKERV